MYAIIETNGQQFKVTPDLVIYVDGLYDKNLADEIKFDKVLSIDDSFGKPYLKNACVTGIVEKHGKTKKTLVYKYKPKKNYSRVFGHRQKYTRIKIVAINK